MEEIMGETMGVVAPLADLELWACSKLVTV